MFETNDVTNQVIKCSFPKKAPLPLPRLKERYLLVISQRSNDTEWRVESKHSTGKEGLLCVDYFRKQRTNLSWRNKILVGSSLRNYRERAECNHIQLDPPFECVTNRWWSISPNRSKCKVPTLLHLNYDKYKIRVYWSHWDQQIVLIISKCISLW